MRKIKLNSIYKHFKGDLYLVEDLAMHSETKETLVIYRHLYGLLLMCKTYGYVLSEVDHEKYPDVKQKYRFEEIIVESKVRKED